MARERCYTTVATYGDSDGGLPDVAAERTPIG